MRRALIAALLALALAAPFAALAGDAKPAASDAKAEAKRMTVDEVKKRMDAGEKIVFIDARSSVSDEMIKGAEHVPASELANWAEGKPRDALIITYCA